nr:MAG TPA: Terminase small subunit [Caudoviricetes sp.]
MPKKQMDPLEQLTTALDGEMKRLLAAPYGSPCVQLQLFSDFCEVKAARKGKNKWNFEDELLAQFLARGYSRLEAYKLSHKDSKTANLNTLYPNASRACNRSNVLARVEEIKRELQARALMSTTEYFSILNDIARKPSKNGDRTAALKMIGQIKGVFQAEKGLPGSACEPLVLAWATAPEPATGPNGAEGTRTEPNRAEGTRRIESQSSCSEFPNSCRGNEGTRTEEKRGAYSGGVADGRKQDKAASSFSVSLGSLADQKEGGRHA